jgi:hypothetical protein
MNYTPQIRGARPRKQLLPRLWNLKKEMVLKQNREHNRETVKSWNSEASASLSTGRYNPLTKQV